VTSLLTPDVTIESLSFMPKSIRERLIDGEVTEEQLIDMLEARGASLVDANRLNDDDFVLLLTGCSRPALRWTGPSWPKRH